MWDTLYLLNMQFLVKYNVKKLVFYRPKMADCGGLSLRLIIDEVDKVETELKELSRTQEEEEAAVQLLKQMLEKEDREIQQVWEVYSV